MSRFHLCNLSRAGEIFPVMSALCQFDAFTHLHCISYARIYDQLRADSEHCQALATIISYVIASSVLNIKRIAILTVAIATSKFFLDCTQIRMIVY